MGGKYEHHLSPTCISAAYSFKFSKRQFISKWPVLLLVTQDSCGQKNHAHHPPAAQHEPNFSFSTKDLLGNPGSQKNNV